jgi:hypothetical protein
MLVTVSLINEPINFYDYYVFDVILFNTFIFIAPAAIIKGLRAKTINVNCHELINANINDIDTVDKFMHITAHTPDIMLFSW